MGDPQPDVSNPLLDHHRGWAERGDRDAEGIRVARARYAFAVPNGPALELIQRSSPDGLVEIGAGRGYWAQQLVARGTDVKAYDVDPPQTERSRWFEGPTTFHPVEDADHRVVADHGERTLLMVWPTKGEAWPAETLEIFHAAGGTLVAYVGQPPGGATGDEWFHALLGELGRCMACVYGVVSAPCTCAVVPMWRRRASLLLPSFDDIADELRIYSRVDTTGNERIDEVSSLPKRSRRFTRVRR